MHPHAVPQCRQHQHYCWQGLPPIIMSNCVLATCNLNQWALDFDGNLSRIEESIRVAKAEGAKFRLGPELEITGYGCQDHFLEQDTFYHTWQSLASLLSPENPLTENILCDVGAPIMFKNVRYNCRLFLLNHKILLIRPKLFLANDGNYREERWFTAWDPARMGEKLESMSLPAEFSAVTGQKAAPFGIAIVDCLDTSIASETCEELFTPDSPNVRLGLDGAEIIANGSGSHHQLRKLQVRLGLIQNATIKGGGAYLYSNQQGCDGGRLYYDGCALIVVNGEVIRQGTQFSVADVEVLTATVNLDAVRSMRGAIQSRAEQAKAARPLPRVQADIQLCSGVWVSAGNTGARQTIASGSASASASLSASDAAYVAATHGTMSVSDTAWLRMPTPPVKSIRIHDPMEEIAYGPACWLWDYLRRSGASGFFLPLSGGADSASVCAIVGIMCGLVADAVRQGNAGVIRDSRRVAGEDASSSYLADDPVEFASRLLHTSFLGTDNSSEATERRARQLAAEVGSYHCSVPIDKAVNGVLAVFGDAFKGRRPQYLSAGGTMREDLALQNVQARLRMVFSYMLASLLPWVRGRNGFLLVLSSANVDEGLRGYMTKYDCSSGDINPIGAVSKADLKAFMSWAAKPENKGYASLAEIVAAPPSAELRPIAEDESKDYTQTDEEDMGMTYDELGWFGRLRKISRLGPVGMFQKLVHVWDNLSPSTVAGKVKFFFKMYAINRHKMTTLTPSYHAENYSPDDNRFDLRQFLYPPWGRQFATIDALATQAEAVGVSRGGVLRASLGSQNR